MIEIEATFDKHVNIKDVIIRHFDLDHEGVTSIYNYWKLKRRVLIFCKTVSNDSMHIFFQAGGNRPLISPPSDDPDMLGKTPAQADQEKLRMFVQLRQDLERVSVDSFLTIVLPSSFHHRAHFSFFSRFAF